MLNPAIANIHLQSDPDKIDGAEIDRNMCEFHALLTNGCHQIQVHHKTQNEHLFHLYLQAHYPYYICLYVNNLS
ncbi:hypothetical protein [Alteromonas sp. W364]|uniref:hypothetical protein n=1 Tax=Alteromonas sp. W364 TaxID=3075610 RepID=UPI002888896F|nr:hypothetical protein [Alteromonas sp. W364]MDT0629817.1 hypothetical protein [Alteromonas sp. W364]